MIEGRQKDILDILYRSGRVSVNELARALYVSEMTVRRDLSEMEKGGYLKRYRGGAVLKVDTREMPISERFYVDEDEKKQLCSLCTAYLRNNITVYIDSSSTCLYIIPHLAKYEKILLVTNSVKALQTASPLHIPCILLGGEYYEQDMCLVGPLTEQFVEEMNFDVAFMTTAAYSKDGVISDFDIRQTAVRKRVIKNTKETVLLFEKNKLDKKLTYTLCTKDEVSKIILLDN
ncbi:MAG: DeoR/GlpR transcriptional regulator [Ruminococcaceae bacterium]|nr:DeoR/GlpR transcriptional regulator [Oscillospiraceae bacterium]